MIDQTECHDDLAASRKRIRRFNIAMLTAAAALTVATIVMSMNDQDDTNPDD